MNNKELNLKEIQEISFEILLKIKEIFEKNNWNYFLAYGTLIGAVRHKGFIPWDDDIDIWVPRDDYEKFIQYCIDNKEAIKPYEMIHYTTNKKYIYPIARFSNSDYKIEYNIAEDYGLGIFVDIYPLDGCNKADKKQNAKIKKLRKIISICGNKSMVKTNSIIKDILKFPYYKYINVRYKKHLNKLLHAIDMLSKKYEINNSDMLDTVAWSVEKVPYRKVDFIGPERKMLEFNGELFQVPYNYDGILTTRYGDYMKMPPKNQQVAHHDYKAIKK